MEGVIGVLGVLKMDLKELAKPFPAEDIEWRVQQAGYQKDGSTIYAIVLAYVSNRAIQQRFDDVFGVNWQNKYEAGPCGGMSCGISVLIDGEWVTRWDGAGERTTETIKSYYSDSMKRAGVQWGVGRYLYKMPVTFAQVHAGGSQSGKFTDKKSKRDVWFKWDTPTLPSWALPQSHTQTTKQAVKPTKQENATTAPPAQEKTQEEIDKGLAVREMKECKNKNAILFDIVADNLGIKGKTPAELSLYQCNQFIDEFIQRAK